MHFDSFKEMGRVLERYVSKEKCAVVDIGSQLIVGLGLQKTYRDLMKPGWDYLGIDIVESVNVDIVMKGNLIPIGDDCIDVVISGQCLEHCDNPFSLVKEMARITKINGFVIITAPWSQGRHLDVDRWRFLPQGFKSLFDYAGLKCVDVYLNQTYKYKVGNKDKEKHLDCWGIGRK